MTELIAQIEDLLVADLASVMSGIEYGDPLPDLSDAVYAKVDELTRGLSQAETQIAFDTARQQAYPRVLAILRAKAAPTAA
jgi:hypothetical protein